MYKNILSKINFGIYLLIAIFFIIIQSTIFSYYPFIFIQPDLFLILVIFFGFKRNSLEGAIFVMIMSLILEAHSSTGKYFFFSIYLYSFLAAKLLSRMMVVSNFLSTIGIVVSFDILKKIGFLILLSSIGKLENSIMHFFIYLIPGAFVQAFLTPILFDWFVKLDLATYKLDSTQGEFDT